MCGKRVNREINAERYVRWQAGELIQNVFPDWPADERELLVSGTCSDCWDKSYPEDREEDNGSDTQHNKDQ